MAEEQEYFDIKAACEFLGIKRSTLDLYVREGRITRYKRGAPRQTVYRLKDLQALKEVKQVKRPAKPKPEDKQES